MQIRPYFARLQAESYAAEPHTDGLLDCALGTNPYGPAPALLECKLPAEALGEYPEAYGAAFCEALARYWAPVARVSPAHFSSCAGSFDALERLNRLFLAEGDAVLGVAPQFSDYRDSVLSFGARYQPVPLHPEAHYTFRPDDVLARIDSSYKLVYLDNPNNPTGQAIPLPQVEAIAAAARAAGACLVVDEAYGDYLPMQHSAICLLERYDNIAVVRSFSKAFGLPGLRVGYLAAGAGLQSAYQKANHPFAAGAAGLFYAPQALRESAWLTDTARQLAQVKQQVLAELKTLPRLHAAHSHAGVPILMLHTDADCDLPALLRRQGVAASALHGFDTLDKRFARLRMPHAQQAERLLCALRRAAAEI